MRLPESSSPNSFWDYWSPIFFTLALYTGIRHYIAEARYIPSGSMLPTLQINDRLLIEKLTYKKRAPKYGEIVVFNSPYAFDPVLRGTRSPSAVKCALINFPLIAFLMPIGDPACDAYIKRVVAIEGDEVLVNSNGQLFRNGLLINEPYVLNFCHDQMKKTSKCRSIKTLVPYGHVLVLGDNRSNSWDSRYWPGGPSLPKKEILGRAIWRFWPFDRLGSLVI